MWLLESFTGQMILVGLAFLGLGTFMWITRPPEGYQEEEKS